MPNFKEILYTGAIALLAVAVANRVTFLGKLIAPPPAAPK